MDVGKLGGGPSSVSHHTPDAHEAPGARPSAQSAGSQRPFVQVLNEGTRFPPTDPSLAAQSTAHPTKTPGTGAAIRNFVQGTLDVERELDRLITAASSGKTFSPAELLALQAKVGRYSQAVEVVSRTTDKLVGAIKQILGTPV